MFIAEYTNHKQIKVKNYANYYLLIKYFRKPC